VQLDPSAFLADSELINALEKRSAPVPCNEDRVLFRQGDPPVGLYILSEGEAAVSMDSGSDSLAFTCQAVAGSLLGLPGLIANQPYSLSAKACKGSKVGFISREDFNGLMQSELALTMKILQVLAAEVRSARLVITQG
jgi:CRP-like cAMP-binding protein